MGRALTLAAIIVIAIAATFALRPAEVRPSRLAGAKATVGAAPVGQRVLQPDAHTPGPRTSQTVRYRFAYAADVQVDRNPMPRVRLEGLWDQTPTAEGALVQLSAVTLEAHDALPEAKSLERRFGLNTAGGELVELGYERDADAATRRTFAMLAAAFWLTTAPAPDATEWTVEEEDIAGPYTATYRRSGDVITKEIGAYLGLRGPDGLNARAASAVTNDGTVTYEMDALGVARVSVAIDQLTAPDDESVHITTRIVATLERVDTDLRAVAAGGLRFGGFENLVDYSGEQTRLDAERVGDADVRSMLADLDRLERLGRGKHSQKARSALLKQMSALVRLEPEAATRFAADLKVRAHRGESTSLLAGALASADTAAGTNALAAVIGDADMPVANRRNAMNTLGLTRTPTSESLDALMAELDGEMGAAAAMAAGSQARELADSAPEQADSAVRQLIDAYTAASTLEEKAMYIKALGNTGSREALPVFNAAIAMNDQSLTPVAIHALRFVPGGDVDETLKPLVLSALYADAALSAIKWRSVAVWTAPLQQAREVYANLESGTRFVETIDRILAQWSA